MTAKITVVIPTLAQASRATALWTAIESCLAQRRTTVAVIVAINGTRYDDAIRRELERSPRLMTSYDPVGNLPRAIAGGRSRVGTEFFTFLDDDDYMLPDTLAERVARLARDETTDVMVANGYRYSISDSSLLFGGERAYQEMTRDPLKALFKVNWLASCGGIFRSATIPAEFFNDSVQYFEWTYFAFRLASQYRVGFDPTGTYVICDSPESLSKAPHGKPAELLLWSKVSPLLGRRPDLRSTLRTRVADAHHSCSEHFRQLGAARGAWKHHALSLVASPGASLRYASYTRHLMADFFRLNRKSTN
jgi:glycosyltransferase involved in cell wall biosynthesis